MLPSSEFKHLTDTQLRERARRFQLYGRKSAEHQERIRMIQELAVRRALRQDSGRVIIKANSST